MCVYSWEQSFCGGPIVEFKEHLSYLRLNSYPCFFPHLRFYIQLTHKPGQPSSRIGIKSIPIMSNVPFRPPLFSSHSICVPLWKNFFHAQPNFFLDSVLPPQPSTWRCQAVLVELRPFKLCSESRRRSISDDTRIPEKCNTQRAPLTR